MVEKPCILGFTSQPWSFDTGAWYDTHIGGQAVWPDSPAATIPPCLRCSSPRYLVLQAYAPHVAHAQRFILLFGCNNIRCSEHADAWLALRVCQIEPVAKSEQTKSSPADAQLRKGADVLSPINWDDSGPSESDEDDLTNDLHLLSLQVDLARAKKDVANLSPRKQLSNATTVSNRARPSSYSNSLSSYSASGQQLRPCISDNPAFPAFYVDVEQDGSDKQKDNGEDISVASLLQKYLEDQKKHESSGPDESWAAEPDEDDAPNIKAFQNFQNTISRAPAQILRYCFGSQPVWPAHPSPASHCMQPCECGAPMVFELQVLGTCLHYLKADKNVQKGQKDAGMSFATIALFTCVNDCTLTSKEILYRTEAFHAFEMMVRVMRDEW